jgi:hypothetical protein
MKSDDVESASGEVEIVATHTLRVFFTVVVVVDVSSFIDIDRSKVDPLGKLHNLFLQTDEGRPGIARDMRTLPLRLLRLGL